ncbi:MAG: ankyrin repeat domain-containing protein [Syntrophaceae bacterium]|nr:ankyrin repeat domain-containing protein [Syntrophaceae bacterium]
MSKKNEKFIEACKKGSLNKVKRLLAPRKFLIFKNKKRLQKNEEVDKNGNKPLHLASYYNRKDICMLLIANGAKLNAKTSILGTPLHIASNMGHKEIAELLIANGADVDATDKYFGETALFEASKYGHKEIVELLIANGADVNATDNAFGETLLFKASNNVEMEIMELLIANGADVNATNNYGTTPLIKATSEGHKEIVELLIANGADVNTADDFGETPLIKASSEGHKEIVELLIANGADVNATVKNSETPLIAASNEGHDEIVELLVANGAKRPATDVDIDSVIIPVFQWSGNDFAGSDQTWVDKVRRENNSAISWFNAQNFVPIPTDEEVSAKYCFDMALIAQNRGNVKETWAGFHQALRRFARLQDEKMLGLTCFNLGKFYGFKKKWEMARLMFLQSAYLANKTGDEKGYAYALSYLGDTTYKLGNKSLAIKLISTALPIFKRVSLDDVPGVQAALRRIKGK